MRGCAVVVCTGNPGSVHSSLLVQVLDLSGCCTGNPGSVHSSLLVQGLDLSGWVVVSMPSIVEKGVQKMTGAVFQWKVCIVHSTNKATLNDNRNLYYS